MSSTPFPLSLPPNPLKAWAKITIGRFRLALSPALGTRLLAGDFRLPLPQTHRCALLALAQRAEREGNPEMMLRVHRRFWTEANGGAEHLKESSHRYTDMFLNNHQQIVGHFAAAVASVGVRRIAEIGCGRGDVLQHLAREMRDVARFVGMDLSAAMVKDNALRNTDPRISFECGDAGEWVAADAVAASHTTAYFSYGGVLEFLPREDVLQLFTAVAKQRGATVIGLVEPLNESHDLDNNAQSISYGHERSLSHNYVSLLLEAGFQLAWREDMRTGPQRWLLIVAKTQGLQ